MRVISTSCAAAGAMLFLFHPLTAAAAPPSDACMLLTTQQVGAALGGPVSAGKSIATGVCQWTEQGKPGEVLFKLDVNLVTPERYARFKTVTVGTKSNVGGLGDEAFYSTFTQGRTTLTTLYIKKGGAAVTINVSGGMKSAEEYQTKERAVAMALLPKL
jgi:hypothetical protein